MPGRITAWVKFMPIKVTTKGLWIIINRLLTITKVIKIEPFRGMNLVMSRPSWVITKQRFQPIDGLQP